MPPAPTPSLALIEVDGEVPAEVPRKVQALPRVRQAKPLRLHHHRCADMYVLALPIAAGSEILALAAFIGGLSAAAAMVSSRSWCRTTSQKSATPQMWAPIS
jgi:hypothetical protein